MKQKKKILAVVLSAVSVLLLLLLLKGMEAHAAWVEQTVDGSAAYSMHPIQNYLLDFYVDSGSWAPWNWGDKAAAGIYTGIHNVGNLIWAISLYLSYFVGWVLEQAYQLDFLTDAIDLISGNIQSIAGVNTGGLLSKGIFPSFIPILIVVAGAYFAWVGLVKRKTSQAFAHLAAFVVTFVLGMGVIAYSGNYLHTIHNFQREFNQEILDISASITTGDAGAGAVGGMRDTLFSVMVKTPYLLLQYGTSDEEAVGGARIDRLLAEDPVSEAREEIVKTEVTELDNENMGLSQLMTRIGMVFVVLLSNLIIGGCILVFAGMMIVSQVLFILYVYFFPVAWVFSMFPNSGSQLKRILEKCMETILMRAGISLILTAVCSVSLICYRLSGNGNFLWMMFLQILVYAAALWKTGELLGYMRFGSSSGVDRKVGSFGRALTNMLLIRKMSGKGRKSGHQGDIWKPVPPQGGHWRRKRETSPTESPGEDLRWAGVEETQHRVEGAQRKGLESRPPVLEDKSQRPNPDSTPPENRKPGRPDRHPATEQNAGKAQGNRKGFDARTASHAPRVEAPGQETAEKAGERKAQPEKGNAGGQGKQRDYRERTASHAPEVRISGQTERKPQEAAGTQAQTEKRTADGKGKQRDYRERTSSHAPKAGTAGQTGTKPQTEPEKRNADGKGRRQDSAERQASHAPAVHAQEKRTDIPMTLRMEDRKTEPYTPKSAQPGMQHTERQERTEKMRIEPENRELLPEKGITLKQEKGTGKG